MAAVYLPGQQMLRSGRNDPQIQMAEDAAMELGNGKQENSFSGTPVAIESSLAPFLVIYDQAGNPVSGTGLLHGALPKIPQGIFEYVRQHGEERVTWQPEPGLRFAIVVAYGAADARSGFAMAGASLRETENRERALLLETAAAWAVLVVLAVGYGLAFQETKA